MHQQDKDTIRREKQLLEVVGATIPVYVDMFLAEYNEEHKQFILRKIGEMRGVLDRLERQVEEVQQGGNMEKPTTIHVYVADSGTWLDAHHNGPGYGMLFFDELLHFLATGGRLVWEDSGEEITAEYIRNRQEEMSR